MVSLVFCADRGSEGVCALCGLCGKVSADQLAEKGKNPRPGVCAQYAQSMRAFIGAVYRGAAHNHSRVVRIESFSTDLSRFAKILEFVRFRKDF